MQAYLPSKDDDYKNIQKENLSIALQSVKRPSEQRDLVFVLAGSNDKSTKANSPIYKQEFENFKKQ